MLKKHKKFFLSMDIEEWYHLQYLEKFNVDKKISVIDGLENFLEILNRNKIKCTFFLVAELSNKYRNVINNIIKNGHEIACHSLNHKLPLEQSKKEFISDLDKAKKIIEDSFGINVLGYRAPCFNMNNEYLEIIERVGFKYDSSLILSNINKKYGSIKLKNFIKMEDGIYKNSNNFYEFEIAVYNKFFFNIPLSGTGYMRLINKYLLKYLIGDYLKKNINFLIYTHPYEFSKKNIELPKKLMFSNKFKFNYGKKNLSNKIQYLINNFDPSYKFLTISDFLNDLS